MKARIRFVAIAIGVAIFAGWCPISTRAHAPQRHAITFKDLISMHRVSDPRISPNGQWIAYSVATPDLDANHMTHNIWIVPAAGGESRQLTRGGSDERAAVVSGREETCVPFLARRHPAGLLDLP